MMPLSLSSTSSKVHDSLIEFCDISRPDTDTPPALAALPGIYKTLLSCITLIASRVSGMLAPSTTSLTPLLTRVLASSPETSF